MNQNQPLSVRMRPRKISEIVGQEHLIGEGKALNGLINSKSNSSIFFYGPPGVGKTSLATVIAKEMNRNYSYFNAGIHSKKDLEKIVSTASVMFPTVLIVDEVHRLTKPNQDFLLMKMEEGSIILIGATTENPHMNITPALRSRSFTFELKKPSASEIKKALQAAVSDNERGINNKEIEVKEDALETISKFSNGDVRFALNTLEAAVSSVSSGVLTKEIVLSFMQISPIDGDKDGDAHYNLLSAFQKSIRGSDVDASLHYLARLIKTGDIVSLNRRLTVIAYEDIGLANPEAVNETLNAVSAAEKVGFPEARIIYSYIVTRLAISPKSNVTYKAIKKALSDLETGKDISIPISLHDTHYKGAKSLGKGEGYKYSHDYPFGIVKQQFMPNDFINSRYLEFRDEQELPKIQETYLKLNRMIKE